MIRDIRTAAEKQFGGRLNAPWWAARCASSAPSADADDEFAVGRLRIALEKAGFEEIEFEFEPVAAAFYYESTLDHDEQILIGDFGGGTSDFSLAARGSSRPQDAPRRHAPC